MKPLLSICIPIYNRAFFLDQTLGVFLQEKELFNNDVQLFISDNCSTEDLWLICKKYQDLGLNLQYHRNDENIGMDGNFTICFNKAIGKYVLLLGSDDIPLPGFVKMIVGFLSEDDYGLVHLKIHKNNNAVLTKYQDHDSFMKDVNYWITFISANVVSSKYVKDIEWARFEKSMICQVPLYMEASCRSENNAILYGKFYQEGNDAKNNGGYHIFSVFVENLFAIISTYVQNGYLSQKTLESIKKSEYCEFLVRYIVECLIFKRNDRFDIEGSWQILWRYYGHKPYAYFYLAVEFLRRCSELLLKYLKNLFN